MKGTKHVKSLHIVKCRGMLILRVLIDIWFALDVCPAMTLRRMWLEE